MKDVFLIVQTLIKSGTGLFSTQFSLSLRQFGYKQKRHCTKYANLLFLYQCNRNNDHFEESNKSTILVTDNMKRLYVVLRSTISKSDEGTQPEV